MADPSATLDLAIVGAGPAAQAAAERAARAGLRVLMIDEQARMGGQVLRQPPVGFRVEQWLQGSAYRRLKTQLARVENLAGVTFAARRSVIGLFPCGDDAGFVLLTDQGDRFRSRRVLIATGCYDMPVPRPGWTLPGVMSAGGVQTLVKGQQVVPGKRFIFMGTHPLQLLVADQVLSAGGTVRAVIFAQPLRSILRAFLLRPWATTLHARKLLEAGGSLWRVKNAGTPVIFGVSATRFKGRDSVEGVELSTGDSIACDAIACCYGFIPQSALPLLAGAAARWAAPCGGWAAEHDAWMRASVPDLYVAGETTGVEGADAAMCEGALAGLGVAMDAGALTQPHAQAEARHLRRDLARHKKFAALLAEIAAPEDARTTSLPTDTIICRCEDVTLQTLINVLDGPMPPGDISAVKLMSRAGMGLCQGHGCQHFIMQLLQEKTGKSPGQMHGFTARFPARPTPIGRLLG